MSVAHIRRVTCDKCGTVSESEHESAFYEITVRRSQAFDFPDGFDAPQPGPFGNNKPFVIHLCPACFAKQAVFHPLGDVATTGKLPRPGEQWWAVLPRSFAVGGGGTGACLVEIVRVAFDAIRNTTVYHVRSAEEGDNGPFSGPDRTLTYHCTLDKLHPLDKLHSVHKANSERARALEKKTGWKLAHCWNLVRTKTDEEIEQEIADFAWDRVGASPAPPAEPAGSAMSDKENDFVHLLHGDLITFYVRHRGTEVSRIQVEHYLEGLGHTLRRPVEETLRAHGLVLRRDDESRDLSASTDGRFIRYPMQGQPWRYDAWRNIFTPTVAGQLPSTGDAPMAPAAKAGSAADEDDS